jgi:hypothetical protein
LRRLDVALDLAEAQAEVLDAALGQVHRQGDDVAARHRVERVLVALVVELHEGRHVAHAAVRAAEGDRLVLGPLALDVVDLVPLATGDGALVAGPVARLDLLQGVRVDALHPLERAGRPVARGDAAGVAHELGEDGRALLVGP